MHKTGIVMTMEGDQAVVMTSDGEFRCVTAPPFAQIGSELTWEMPAPNMVRPLRPQLFRLRRLAFTGAAGMVAAVAVVAGVWRLQVQQVNAQPYAYVALDIRPDVQFTVNRRLDVLKATALNADGGRLLHTTRVVNVSLGVAVRAMVHAAAEHHMLPAHDNILIATANVSDAASGALATVQQTVQAQLGDLLASDEAVRREQPQVYAYQVSDAVWNVADKVHVSPAQAAAYLYELSLGRTVPLNELHTVSLTGDGTQSVSPQFTALNVNENDRKTLESELMTAASNAAPASVAGTSDASTGTVAPAPVVSGASPTGVTVVGGNLPSAQLAAWQRTAGRAGHGRRAITVGWTRIGSFMES